MGKPEVPARAFGMKKATGKYYVSNVSHNGDTVAVLVKKDNAESKGVNVIFPEVGETTAQTSDEVAKKQWKDDREKIIKVASATLEKG